MQTEDRSLKLIKKALAVSVASLMLLAGSQTASANTLAPAVINQAPTAPVNAAKADGSYTVAAAKRGNRYRRHHRRQTRRNLAIGLGLAAGAIALGAAAATAREREQYGACRRIERRCARRFGWETRRWFNCVEDRGC